MVAACHLLLAAYNSLLHRLRTAGQHVMTVLGVVKNLLLLLASVHDCAGSQC